MEIRLSKNQGISLIELKSGELELTLSDLGASIYCIKYCGDLMTHTPVKFSNWIRLDSYYGKTIGLIAGRVLSTDKQVILHGGNNGLSNKIFKYEINNNTDKTEVIFTYQNIKITYLIGKNSLEIKFYMNLAKEEYISLTNHAYFNVGETNLNTVKFKIDSKYFVEVDKKTMLPLRKVRVLPCLDFKEDKFITRDIKDHYLKDSVTNGYDHYLYFDKEKKIELIGQKYSLTILTDFEGTQIYSDNYYDYEAKHSQDKENRSIAIEPEDEPIQISKKKSSGVYERYIKYIFAKK